MFTYFLEHLQKYTVSHLSLEEKEEKKNGIIAITIMVGFFAALFFITALGIHYANGQESTQEQMKIAPTEQNEIIELRTENTQTFEIDEKTRRTKIYLGPQFEKINTEWFTAQKESYNPVDTGTITPTKSAFLREIFIDTAWAATATGSSSGDSYIRALNATTNFGTADPNYVGNAATTDEYRTWISFTTTATLGTITSAKLYLYNNAKGTNAYSCTSDIHLSTRQPIESEITWNKYTTSNNWSTPGGDFGSVIDTEPIDGTISEWRNWSLGTINWSTRYDYILKPNCATAQNYDGYASEESATASIRPYIEITYDLDPPTITSFTPEEAGLPVHVIVTGTNFTSAGTLSLNGEDLTTEFLSDTTVHGDIPAGSTDGYIVYTNANGIATSSTQFIVIDTESLIAETNTKMGYLIVLFTILAVFAIFDFMRRTYIKATNT